jgi:hypothetical protein
MERRRLERELGETKATLLTESDDHHILQRAIRLVLDNLGMTSEEGTSSHAAQVIHVTDRECKMARRALHLGV